MKFYFNLQNQLFFMLKNVGIVCLTDTEYGMYFEIVNRRCEWKRFTVVSSFELLSFIWFLAFIDSSYYFICKNWVFLSTIILIKLWFLLLVVYLQFFYQLPVCNPLLEFGRSLLIHSVYILYICPKTYSFFKLIIIVLDRSEIYMRLKYKK